MVSFIGIFYNRIPQLTRAFYNLFDPKHFTVSIVFILIIYL
jgi:hypothetical protein